MDSPRIAVSVGEAAGIGPDLCVLLAQRRLRQRLVLFADPDLLLERAKQLGLPLTIHEFDGSNDTMPAQEVPSLCVSPIKLKVAARAGQLDVANVPYVLAGLDAAIDACISRQCQALLTGPIHKGVINQAGISFTGHTEYLAERCHASQVVMMLQSPTLRVALVTTHLPLKDVAAAITATRLRNVIHVVWHDMRRYLGRPPRIMVSGLNPHAGENGYLGREELDIIEPVLRECRQLGWDIVGPLSADTMFSAENLGQSDVFLCMYHDQGLPVLKYQGFGNAVNITLGLPFLRCSVDHGTALPLAGTGNIDDGSLLYALQTAGNLAAGAHA